MLFGETLIKFEEIRLREKEIELKALIALAKFGKLSQKYEALKHLEFFAYPATLAELINQETQL